MTRMRGDDRGPETMFSYVSAEQRVPTNHPLRAIRALVDDVLHDMSREFDGLYARVGRPSIPPERLLRAQLLQIFYSIRSERLLMECRRRVQVKARARPVASPSGQAHPPDESGETVV
jgi:transposase